jgi:hypothetical protein
MMQRVALLAIVLRQPLGEVLRMPLADLPDWEAAAIHTLKTLTPGKR